MLVEEKNGLKGGTPEEMKEEKEGWKDETKEFITVLNKGEVVSEVYEDLFRGFINTISGGFAGGGVSSLAWKKHLRNAHTINYVFKKRRMPPMLYTNEDFQDIDPEQDDPMVIMVEITEYVVMKTLVDQGSCIDILFWETFCKLNMREENMIPY